MTKRILVIDDEPNIHTIVKISLEKFGGWQVQTASSALEGLQFAQSEYFDAILLDVSMPNIDGFQCFEKLRSQPESETIPVILLTAKVLPCDRKRFGELGVDGVISKPFNPMTIWQEVAKLLSW